MALIILSRRKLSLLKKKLFIVLAVLVILPYLFYLLLGNKLLAYDIPVLAGYGYQEAALLWRIVLAVFAFYDFGF